MIWVVFMVVQVESKAHANVIVHPYIGFLEFLAPVIAEIRLETQKAVGLDFRATIEGIILMLHIVTPAGTQLEIVSQQLVVGMNIILISSEMMELVRNCDRVVVLRDGKVRGTLTGKEISEENMMKTIAEGTEE